MKKFWIILFLVLLIPIAYFLYVNFSDNGKKIAEVVNNEENGTEVVKNAEAENEEAPIKQKVIKEPQVKVETDNIKNKIDAEGISQGMVDQMVARITDDYKDIAETDGDQTIVFNDIELHQGSFFEPFVAEDLIKVRAYNGRSNDLYFGVFDSDKKLKYYNSFELYFTHGGVDSYNYYCKATGKNVILTKTTGCTNGTGCSDSVFLGDFSNNSSDFSQKENYTYHLVTIYDKFEILQRVVMSRMGDEYETLMSGDEIQVYKWDENAKLEKCEAPNCIDSMSDSNDVIWRAAIYDKTLKFNKETCLFE